MTREIVRVPAVLIVDDEALIRWSLSETLAEAGYTTRLASSGAEARVVLASIGNEALVAILDMRLPDVNDLSLVREVRRLRHDAPVILMSAHLSPDDIREAERLGVFRVVSKPFDMTEMVTLVRRAWEGHQGVKS